MKRWWQWLVIGLVVLAWARPVHAGGFQDGQVVFGGSYTVKSGQVLDGDLVVFGGNATVEAGGTVNGTLAVIGGTAEVNGRVNGDLALLGGVAHLGPQAVIAGDAAVMGGTLQREEGAQVLGQVVEGGNTFPLPRSVPGVRVPVIGPLTVKVSPGWQALWMLFRAFLMAMLALLLVLFLERPTMRVAQAAVRQPIPAGGLGLLLLIAAPGTALLMAITLILLPVALLLVFLLALAALFGWLALGTEVGVRLTQAFHRDWPLAAQAALGTFALSFVTGGLDFIPCVGWVPGFAALILGLGAVALTRFGAQPYPPALPPARPEAEVEA